MFIIIVIICSRYRHYNYLIFLLDIHDVIHGQQTQREQFSFDGRSRATAR